MGAELGDADAVLARHVVDDGQGLVEFGKHRVVVREGLLVATQLPKRLLKMRVRRLGELRGRAQAGVVVVEFGEARRKTRGASKQVALQLRHRVADGLHQFLGATQPLVRSGHLLHAQQAVAETVQFVHLVAQEALPFAGLGRRLAAFVQFPGELCAFAVALRRGDKQRRVHAELVEQPPLRLAGEQLPMLALAVDVDQRRREGLQYGQRGRRPVHERPRAPNARHPAHQAGGLFAAGEQIQPLERV